jgi:hypothetical protein
MFLSALVVFYSICSSINIALLSRVSILHTVIIITGSILIVLCSYLVLNISVYINGRNPMKDNYSIVTNSYLASSSVSIYITEALVVKCNYVIYPHRCITVGLNYPHDSSFRLLLSTYYLLSELTYNKHQRIT